MMKRHIKHVPQTVSDSASRKINMRICWLEQAATIRCYWSAHGTSWPEWSFI